MWTQLTLERFKSWREIPEMRLAPITGLFGSNSSGKSSILQWFLLLKQTVESADRVQPLNLGDERGLVELGTFRDIVFNHEKPGQIAWSASWKLPETMQVLDPTGGPNKILFQDGELNHSCTIKETPSERIVVEQFAYRFAARDFQYRRKRDQESYDLTVEPSNNFEFKRARGRAWPLPAPVKCYGFPDQVDSYFVNAGFLPDFQLALEQAFSRLFYLGPLREYPRRQYTWGGAQPADMGRRGERVIDAILASRERGEKIRRGHGKKRRTVEEYTADWLRDLGLIASFDVKPVAKGSNLYQAHVRRTTSSSSVLLTDVGFGVSQILPVIVLCYYVPEGSTVILEQPEIHLHPSVQAGLADAFIDAIKVRKLQIIIESHSEHLLLRLQRRIAEATLSPEQVALYFCDYVDDAAESRLVPLDVDAFGTIQNWPTDFFGDQFGEIAETSRAASRRRLTTAS
jgi:predicted ATPase